MVPVSESRFRLSHWIADVDNIELEFFVDNLDDEDTMIVVWATTSFVPDIQT